MKTSRSHALEAVNLGSSDSNTTRARIINAARVCYTQKDTAQTTMGDIAQQASLARGTLYRHFPTRESILMAVFREEVAVFLQRFLAEVGEAESFCDYLLDFMVYSVANAATAPLLKILFAEQSAIWVSQTYLSDPDTLALTTGIFRESFLVARRVGEISKDLELPEIMDVAVRMMLSLMLIPGAEVKSDAQLRDYFSKYFIRSLVVR